MAAKCDAKAVVLKHEASPYMLNQLQFSQIRREHPLNLSISVSGGKETNKDSLSNGE